MKRNYLLMILIFLNLPKYGELCAQKSENPKAEQEYSAIFNDIKAICDRDNGKLWGLNLYAPTLCIDKAHNVWSNQKDLQNQLHHKEGYFTGKYPEDKNIANSTTEVYGQKWVTVALPLPSDIIERNTLFCHEMFHYWQDTLGLTPTTYNNAHMDKKNARTLLKLEWSAFYSACKATDNSSIKASIRDGISFRKLRQEKYSEYYKDEIAFEIQEGLAQYTGRKLSVPTDSIYLSLIKNDMESYNNKEELVRNYAYLSGVIIGFLLDKSATDWRKHIKADSDLGNILQQTYNITLPTNLKSHCEQVKKAYGYDYIMVFENKRDSVKSIEKEHLKKIFTQNIKKLPLKNIQISFDPNTVNPLENVGNIYKNVRIVDDWGILETKNNGVVLISDDWKTAILPYADNIIIKDSIEETKYWKLKKRL